jgi:hypothetical protein
MKAKTFILTLGAMSLLAGTSPAFAAQAAPAPTAPAPTPQGGLPAAGTNTAAAGSAGALGSNTLLLGSLAGIAGLATFTALVTDNGSRRETPASP